jgi:hypothetical protein
MSESQNIEYKQSKVRGVLELVEKGILIKQGDKKSSKYIYL